MLVDVENVRGKSGFTLGHEELLGEVDHFVALLIVIFFERLEIIALVIGLVGRVLAIDLYS